MIHITHTIAHSELPSFLKIFRYIVYPKPTVNVATASPCAPTRSCMRKTLGLMWPLRLNIYAPYKHAAPHIPTAVINVEIIISLALKNSLIMK